MDRIAVFLAISDVHLRDKLRLTKEQALEKIITEIEYIREHGIKVRYTPEDSTRTEIGFLMKACNAAVEAGADRISIADTLGLATSSFFSQLVKIVVKHIPAAIDVHCHNDFGLALANALAAVDSGADCVHVTVNGL